jgi:hypothetical protein
MVEGLTEMRRRARTVLIGSTLAVLIVSASASRVLACPNCKEAVSSSEGEAASTSIGYNWSVAFMLTVPFSMLGTGVLMVRRAVKRGLLPEM